MQDFPSSEPSANHRQLFLTEFWGLFPYFKIWALGALLALIGCVRRTTVSLSSK